MTDREISRMLHAKHTTPRAIRRSKLKMRYGKSWDRLAAEVRRTREKLDILMDLQRDLEQRRIAWHVAAKEATK